MSKEHDNVKKQLEEPGRRLSNHIRLSKIYQTTQNIKSIHADLAKGYSFDKDKLTDMVNAMFSFINGIARPSEEGDIASEEIVEEIIQ